MSYPEVFPICMMCKHLQKNTDVPRCTAFPEGIPAEIWWQAYDHRRPLNNEAITFELADAYTEEDVEEWEAEVADLEKAIAFGPDWDQEDDEQ